MQSKIIKTGFLLFTLLFIFAGIKYFLSGQIDATYINSADSRVVTSDYGFHLTLPVGWHIWEGDSAGSELFLRDDYITVMSRAISERNSEKGLSTETVRKLREFQTVLNNWNVSSSKNISLTNNENIDYKNRDLAYVGKIKSTPVESMDSVGVTQIMVSGAKVDFSDDSKTIEINDKKARFVINKNFKLVDILFIKLPINSSKQIDGTNVQSLLFTRFVKKDDPRALPEFISFISSLNVRPVSPQAVVEE